MVSDSADVQAEVTVISAGCEPWQPWHLWVMARRLHHLSSKPSLKKAILRRLFSDPEMSLMMLTSLWKKANTYGRCFPDAAKSHSQSMPLGILMCCNILNALAGAWREMQGCKGTWHPLVVGCRNFTFQSLIKSISESTCCFPHLVSQNPEVHLSGDVWES